MKVLRLGNMPMYSQTDASVQLSQNLLPAGSFSFMMFYVYHPRCMHVYAETVIHNSSAISGRNPLSPNDRVTTGVAIITVFAMEQDLDQQPLSSVMIAL